MQQRAIDFGYACAAAAIALSLGIASSRACAQDPAQAAAPAPAAIDPGRTQVGVVKPIAVGGLRPGEVMLITGRGPDVVGPAAHVNQQLPASKFAAGSVSCIGF